MPPWATTTTMPSGLSAYSSSSSSMTGRERRTTSMRDSPPGGAQPGSERHSAIAPGHSASISATVRPCHCPRWVSRSRGSTLTSRPTAAPITVGGVDGAPQVGADQPVRAERGDARGDRRGLRQALRGELGVEVALHPALDVVVGLAVAEQDQPAQRHPSPPACSTCASANAMRGQSFHSRSSP